MVRACLQELDNMQGCGCPERWPSVLPEALMVMCMFMVQADGCLMLAFSTTTDAVEFCLLVSCWTPLLEWLALAEVESTYITMQCISCEQCPTPSQSGTMPMIMFSFQTPSKVQYT